MLTDSWLLIAFHNRGRAQDKMGIFIGRVFQQQNLSIGLMMSGWVGGHWVSAQLHTLGSPFG